MIQGIHKKILAIGFMAVTSLGIAGQAEAGVALGATRVVYPSNQKQVSLGISNNDDKSTYLIQSWIENAAGNAKTVLL
ncbi:Chaperone protein fimC precursor [Tatumella ptyseos]|uniref:Chaperone protein fimC n=1 Tax=Tatumella ptyseos TaxID=82987 RepID=A0A2X5PKL4_9GAMM|nr:Chaperone protein fimC precursor [Tatumella ptyseos]